MYTHNVLVPDPIQFDRYGNPLYQNPSSISVNQQGNIHQNSPPMQAAIAPQNIQQPIFNHQLSPLIPAITREDMYKRVKKLDPNTVKQLLFYESLLIGSIKLFYDFEDDDAYNFLADSLIIKQQPTTQLDYLINLKTYCSLPDSFLKWFSEDLRAGLYFASHVDLQWVQDCYYGGKDFLKWITSIIKVSNLEVVESSISIKPNLNTDQHLRESNLKHLALMKKQYLDFRTADKKIDWLSLKDAEQVQWAYDYLIEHEKVIFNGVFYPKSVNDKYYLILATLDVSDNKKIKHKVPNGKNTLTFTDREFFIYKMRRAWNSILNTRKKNEQKNNRAIVTNQVNYDRLLTLCSSNNSPVTPTKMVNKLIEDKYLLMSEYLKTT